MKHWFVGFGLILSTACYSQATVRLEQKPFVVYHKADSAVLKVLSGFSTYKTASLSEKEGYYWVNLMRKDPPGFARNFVSPFLQQFPDLNSREAESLLSQLEGLQPLPFVAPEKVLQKEAELHAVDLATRQHRLSHESSDGRSFGRRMQDAGIKNCGGENVFEGGEEPLKALILLLIDKGLPGLGHRKTLLNPMFDLMGTAFRKTSSGQYYMVQLFSCK